MNELNEKIVHFSVGSRFPLEQYLKGEMSVSIISSNFFDVLVSVRNITKEVIRCWTKSTLTVSLFERESIPFLIYDFGNWDFDVSIVTNRMSEEHLDSWLNKESNIVNMFLVDSETGILKSIRSIGLNFHFSEAIRDICEKQSFIDSEVVKENHEKIYAKYSTSDMIKQAQYRQSFLK